MDPHTQFGNVYCLVTQPHVPNRVSIPGMEAAKDCVLVIMGVDDKGNKELLAISDGYRESKDSWLDLLRDLKYRGLKRAPKIAVGDGAMGFWGAMTEEYPDAQHQRCWFHKMGNVLEKLPKAEQAQAKKALQEIWLSSTKKKAYLAFDKFIAAYDAKYPKATACLLKDKDKLKCVALLRMRFGRRDPSAPFALARRLYHAAAVRVTGATCTSHTAHRLSHDSTPA